MAQQQGDFGLIDGPILVEIVYRQQNYDNYAELIRAIMKQRGKPALKLEPKTWPRLNFFVPKQDRKRIYQIDFGIAKTSR